jgi:hypothetical protein
VTDFIYFWHSAQSREAGNLKADSARPVHQEQGVKRLTPCKIHKQNSNYFKMSNLSILFVCKKEWTLRKIRNVDFHFKHNMAPFITSIVLQIRLTQQGIVPELDLN